MKLRPPDLATCAFSPSTVGLARKCSSLALLALCFAGSAVGQILSPPQVLPGDTTFAPPAGDQQNVVFARGAGTTLMVWEDSRSNLTLTQNNQGVAGPNTDLYASRLDDAGNRLDTPPIHLTHGAFSQTVPKVAWNGQHWLVVWTSRSAGPSFATQGVFGARVAATGQVMDDPPIVIRDTVGFDEREPVVASDGSNWAVIWFANIAFGTDGVQGCLVDAAGTPGAPSTFFQTSPTSSNYYVPVDCELAWAGGRYLLVSDHYNPGPFDRNIYGQFFDASLAKIGGEFAIATNTPWDQSQPSIAANGTGFFVTWYDAQLPGQVRGTPVSVAGVVAVPNGTIFEIPPSDVHTAAGWDGVNWVAAWTGSPTSANVVRLARVAPTGAMLAGSPFTVSAGNRSKYSPAVGTLNAGAIVAWTDERNVSFFFSNAPAGIDTTDLYGAVVDASGAVAPDQSLLFSPPAQTRPDIAGSAASGYLVTFLSETAASASVMAQRLDASGMPIDPQPIVVATGSRLLRNPAIAFDGTVWLVAWEELTLTGSSGAANVFARRVGANGIPIDPAPILVVSGNTPDVAAVGGVFLVVSSFAPGHFRSIHGARVRGSDGAVLDPTPIFIGSYYSVDPAVTAFSDRWLVAWQGHPSHDNPNSGIAANFVLANGTPLGQFLVAVSGKAPCVTAGGSTALAAWNGSSDVLARRVLPNGTMLDTSAGFVVSNAFNRQFSPESGWDGSQWFVAWNDYRAHTNILDGCVGDLHGARVQTGGTVTDPAGLAIANDFALAEGNPAVAGDLGSSITAYAMLRDESPYGMVRVTLRTLNPPVCSGTVLSYGAGCPGTGGMTPSYAIIGCPTPGGGLACVVTNALPGSQGILGFGLNQAAIPFGGGCLLRIDPLIPFFPNIPIAGNGSGSFSLQVPLGTSGLVVTTQAFVIDGGVPQGFANTNGVQLNIQ